MQCPHCNYKNGWDSETIKTIHGKEGRFYYLAVELKRPADFRNDEVTLYGCPKCKKTFIELKGQQ
jgi:hypothetical protein